MCKVFRKTFGIIFVTLLLITFFAGFGQNSDIAFAQCDYFSDDFESGSGQWTLNSPWIISDENSHSPDNCLTDSPGGIAYDSDVNISATSTSIDLSTATIPVLTFWHQHHLETDLDFGYVEVSKDLGASWQTVYYVTGLNTEWVEEKVDLTEYAYYSDIRIRFRLQSNATNNFDGWYIDDICIGESTCTIPYPFFDDMESGDGNWLTSSWDLDSPGHSGTTSMTDSPAGNTPRYINNYLTMCDVIDLSAADNPQLIFWHHYDQRSYDTAFSVQVSDSYGQGDTYKNGEHNSKSLPVSSHHNSVSSLSRSSRKDKLDAFKQRYLEKEKIKRKKYKKKYRIHTYKKTYKLGKKKERGKVDVLIKNNTTRKKVKKAVKELEKTPLLEVKRYLKQKGLIKTGSNAPEYVMREIYKNSMLAGDISNKNNDVLVHNYFTEES